MLKTFVRVLTVALSVVGLVSAARAQQQPIEQKLASESVIEQIISRGSLRIGISTFVPWAMPNKDGKLIGFEVDVAQRLADDMGVKLELVPTAWDGIIPALIGGKFDFIIGGMTITPKRALTINFSNGYDYSALVVVVNKKIAPDITALDQLNSPNVTFAVRRGATSPVVAAQLFPKAKLVQFDDENSQNQEVINGNATATLVSTPSPAILLEQHPDILRQIMTPLQKSYDGIGVRKGDPDALAYLNSWIMVHQEDGWLEQRHNYWFNGRAWANQIDPNAH
jgi:polar amino acid transport system substrate-binding protein